MKIRAGNRRHGGILVTTLIVCMLVGIMLTAYLAMVSQQQTFTQRSQIWNHCIPMCEGGMEEALAHINHPSAKTSFAVNGFNFQDGFYRKERPINLGWARMAIDTSMPPVITVVGDLRAPLKTNWVSRAVRVRTQYKEQAINGMLARSTISMNGHPSIDSFNSTNMAQSNNGQYDSGRATDHAFVGTISQSPGNLSIGNATVYGSVATGAEGTVSVGPNGSVGSTAFNNDPSSSGVEDGHATDDLNIVIDDNVLPADFGPLLAPGKGVDVMGTNYGWVFGRGDYQINGDFTLSGQQGKVIVTNKARLYVMGMTKISGQAFVLIGNNASLELYAGGTVDIGGNGIVNFPGGYAKNFSVIGLKDCQKVTIAGNAPYVGTINAPNADVSLQGTSDVFGAVVGKTIKVGGNVNFHYDEALPAITKRGRYIPYRWEELKPEDFAGLFKK